MTQDLGLVKGPREARGDSLSHELTLKGGNCGKNKRTKHQLYAHV